MSEKLPACPNCHQETKPHCATSAGCKWLYCPKCFIVFGQRNSFRYGKAEQEEREAEQRKNGTG